MADLDQFEHTAAWLEFCDGMTRFQAETEAARRQGLTRWQMMEAARNAERNGHSEGGGDLDPALDGQRGADNVPGVQPREAQEAGRMSERDTQAGWPGVELLSLRA